MSKKQTHAERYAEIETENVKVSGWPGETDRTIYSDRYVVYTKDEDGEWSEELDFDCKPRTPTQEVKKVAKAQLDFEYEPGLTIASVEQKFGMYL